MDRRSQSQFAVACFLTFRRGGPCRCRVLRNSCIQISQAQLALFRVPSRAIVAAIHVIIGVAGNHNGPCSIAG